MVDEIGCIREVTLRGVLFDTDSAELTADATRQIDGALAQYRTLPSDAAAQTRVTIEGHTDNAGPDAHNQQLSERRANMVRDYAVSQGIAAAPITAVGKGQSGPAGDNSTRKGRRSNRRVLIRAAR